MMFNSQPIERTRISTPSATLGLVAARSLVFFAIVVMGCQKETIGTLEPEAAVTDAIENQQESDFETETAVKDTLLGEDSKLITPIDGGTLQIRSSKLTVPPGALALPTTIIFRILTIDPPKGIRNALKRVITFSPDGLVFLRPCTLEINAQELGGDLASNKRALTCFYYNPLTQRYQPQATAFKNENGGKYIVTINHFSAYAFGRVVAD